MSGRRGAPIGRPSGYGTLASELLNIGDEAKGEEATMSQFSGRFATV